MAGAGVTGGGRGGSLAVRAPRAPRIGPGAAGRPAGPAASGAGAVCQLQCRAGRHDPAGFHAVSATARLWVFAGRGGQHAGGLRAGQRDDRADFRLPLGPNSGGAAVYGRYGAGRGWLSGDCPSTGTAPAYGYHVASVAVRCRVRDVFLAQRPPDYRLGAAPALGPRRQHGHNVAHAGSGSGGFTGCRTAGPGAGENPGAVLLCDSHGGAVGGD